MRNISITLLLILFPILCHARSQEQYAPYPYDTIPLKVTNDVLGIELAGTLTMPMQEKPRGVVIFISGSGDKDRDLSYGRHKPFRVLSDLLTMQGFSTFRLDDRGIGESQKADSAGTTQGRETDFYAAMKLLKQQPRLKDVPFGYFGHGEGGAIALKLLKDSPLPDFLITYGSPLTSGQEMMLNQMKKMIDEAGQSSAWPYYEPMLRKRYAMVASEVNDEELKEALRNDMLKSIPEQSRTAQIMEQVNAEVERMSTPWYRNFMRYQPDAYMEGMTIPWLILQGENDMEVPPSNNKIPAEILNKSNITSMVIPGLNHIMQKAYNGAPEYYDVFEETVNPLVTDTLLEWFGTNRQLFR